MRGKQCHAAYAYLGADPIVAASAACLLGLRERQQVVKVGVAVGGPAQVVGHPRGLGVRVMGEHNHRITDGEAVISLHDFDLRVPAAEHVESAEIARLFEEAFARVFNGEVENDDFNRLVLRAGLSADEVVILRAYAKYCKQIGFALPQGTIEAALSAHLNPFKRKRQKPVAWWSGVVDLGPKARELVPTPASTITGTEVTASRMN